MGIENKHVHEAYSAIFKQDYKRAIDSFRRAIRCNPKSPSIYYKLSITYARNNEIDKGIMAVKEAIRLAGGNQAYQFHLQNLLIKKLAQDAQSALDEGEDITAYIPQLEEFIEVDPLELQLKWMLGKIYFILGDKYKADQQMKEILEINPEHQQALQYFKIGREMNTDVH